ncbi:MAG: ABC transporter substrate-binding protein [Treponema sp.]|nr:ABC transporter substrate-binding protein [Treponema sp.]
MKKLVKTALMAVLLISVTLNFTFAKTNKKVVRIGTAAGTSANFYGNLAVAKELGFVEEEFKKIGYDVEYIGFANGVAVNEALAADDLDIVSIGDLPAATSYANGLDNVWIGTTYAINDKAIIVRGDSPISSPQDFTGKTVAYQNGTAYQFVFEKYTEEYKLDKSKIEVSNIAFANGLAALLRGDVDAVIGTYESALAAVKQNEGKIKIIFNT